jgi:hypothetical protein
VEARDGIKKDCSDEEPYKPLISFYKPGGFSICQAFFLIDFEVSEAKHD